MRLLAGSLWMATTWLGQSALLNVASAKNRNTHVPAAMIQEARRAKVGAGRSLNDPVEPIGAERAMALKIGKMAVSSPKLAVGIGYRIEPSI